MTFGRFASLCLSAAFLAGGLVNTAQAALCQFNIGWDSRYTAYVRDTSMPTAVHAYITPLTATWVGGDDPTQEGLPKNFETYCIDLGNTLQSPQWWESGAFPNPNSAPGNPIWTVDGIYKAAWLYKNYAADTSHGDATKSGAALQLAIWEVLYEDPGANNQFSYSVLNGNFLVQNANWAFTSDGVAGLADTYLGGLPPVNSMEIIKSTWWDARSTTSRQNQDLLGPAPVPEPATYIAGALLVLPFLTTLLYRRLRKS